jgi:peptidoglycan/LPS O-acetylase OafA/YrhL
LSIECLYYVVAPFLQRIPRWVLPAIAGASALCHIAQDRGFLGNHLFGMNAWTHCWAWLIGFHCYRNRGSVWSVPLLFAGLIVIYLCKNEFGQPGAIWLYLLSALAIITAHRVSVGARAGAATNWLGDISYPLYLLHMPCFLLAYFLLGLRNRWSLLIFSLVFSITAFYGIDIYVKKHWLLPLMQALTGYCNRVAAHTIGAMRILLQSR